MTSADLSTRVDALALAERGGNASGAVLLQKMERIAPEFVGLQPDMAVKWAISGEFRTSAAGGAVVWMHLQADAPLPLVCQRCMGPVTVPVHIDHWYRFVDSEEVALAEDDESEEDLLVLEPQLDLAALLEDELLMAIPVVAMHETCPVTPEALLTPSADASGPEAAPGKPNPFAALARLKTGKT